MVLRLIAAAVLLCMEKSWTWFCNSSDETRTWITEALIHMTNIVRFGEGRLRLYDSYFVVRYEPFMQERSSITPE